MVVLSTATPFFWPLGKTWDIAQKTGFEGLEVFMNTEVGRLCQLRDEENLLRQLCQEGRVTSFHAPWARGAYFPGKWLTLPKHAILCSLHVVAALQNGKRPIWPFARWDESDIISAMARIISGTDKGGSVPPLIVDDDGPFDFSGQENIIYEICEDGRHTVEQAVEQNLSVCFDTKHIREIPGMTLERAWAFLKNQVREIHFQPTLEELSYIFGCYRIVEVERFLIQVSKESPDIPVVVEVSPAVLHGVKFWDEATALERLPKIRRYLHFLGH